MGANVSRRIFNFLVNTFDVLTQPGHGAHRRQTGPTAGFSALGPADPASSDLQSIRSDLVEVAVKG